MAIALMRSRATWKMVPNIIAHYTSSARGRRGERASSWSPLSWVREKLAPGAVEKLSEREVAAAKHASRQDGTSSVFEALPQAVIKKERQVVTKERASNHKYSTSNFKISHRRLNMLANQISTKPIDYAILQMQFSEKRASIRIMNMLCTAKDHAIRYKKLDPSRLVVEQAWVSKGPRPEKRLEPRARGHFGIRIRNNAKMSVILSYGKTLEEKKAAEFNKKLKRVVSSSLVREDVPLRNPARTWTW
ncbi:ribosomal protein L22 [Coprinopsis marcescibilis]|uniref:Ribosomal protein L22 n=1 Tax=Coprinopsis marcescibilis TaxID=230819 RepID=A0A5C3L6V4_COPMA|nr:ribosomal protein L22 [Coprinopsis marcescibilis]